MGSSSHVLAWLVRCSLLMMVSAQTDFKVYMSATSCKVRAQSTVSFLTDECKQIMGYTAAAQFGFAPYYKPGMTSCNSTGNASADTTPTLLQYSDSLCNIATGKVFSGDECTDLLTGSDAKLVYQSYKLECYVAGSIGVSGASFAILLAWLTAAFFAAPH
mmetsp:Transcript_4936/g.10012  ORF Transcript_4936/g.10012 Transcript_4936/m.10012 type:complete len:160 (+) Transcript_4936:93-572(+)